MCNTHTISHVKLWTSPFRFPFSQSPHPAPVWSLVSSCRSTWWRRPLYCVRSFAVVLLLDEAEVKPQKRFPVSCTFYSWQKRSGRRNIPYEWDPSYQLLNFRSYSWKSKFHPTILFLSGGLSTLLAISSFSESDIKWKKFWPTLCIFWRFII